MIVEPSTNARAQEWLGPNDACAPDTLLGDWGGSRATLAAKGIRFGLQNQTELWGNLTGGRRQAINDGLATASLCIDLGKAAQWKGATIFASGFQIYGPGPSIPLLGSLQLVSNIEATPSTKLYDLWSSSSCSAAKSWFASGSKGRTYEFMIAPYAGFLLNSSFGYPALLAIDLPSGGPKIYIHSRFRSCASFIPRNPKG